MTMKRLLTGAAYIACFAAGLAVAYAPHPKPTPQACEMLVALVAQAQDEGNDSLAEAAGEAYEQECER